MMKNPGVATDPSVHTKENFNKAVKPTLLEGIVMLMVVIPSSGNTFKDNTNHHPRQNEINIIKVKVGDHIDNKK